MKIGIGLAIVSAIAGGIIIVAATHAPEHSVAAPVRMDVSAEARLTFSVRNAPKERAWIRVPQGDDLEGIKSELMDELRAKQK